jgi:hypothetical protein
MADILVNHGYCLSIKQEKRDESYERRNTKSNKKVRAGNQEILQKGGELK